MPTSFPSSLRRQGPISLPSNPVTPALPLSRHPRAGGGPDPRKTLPPKPATGANPPSPPRRHRPSQSTPLYNKGGLGDESPNVPPVTPGKPSPRTPALPLLRQGTEVIELANL